MLTKFASTPAVAVTLLFAPIAVSAQGLEALGSRGAALGAFVAVADDASAVAWNPAGLVAGPLFNISVDVGRTERVPEGAPAPSGHAGKLGATLVALGTIPFGIAYYRLSSTSANAVSPAELETPGRQDPQVIVRNVVTSHLGVSVLQSLGDHLTVGTMLKLVRAEVGTVSGSAPSWDAALAAADRVEKDGFTRGDLDIGVMASAGRLRAGLVVRNVTEPTFGDDDRPDPLRLPRHARVGVAWGDRWPGTSQTVFAFDADLTEVAQAGGERRDVAAGVERWMVQRRVGLRAGVRASTFGDARPIISGGGSFGLRAGLYVDGYAAGGQDEDRAWGVGVRLTY